jgi:hypothetical protein
LRWTFVRVPSHRGPERHRFIDGDTRAPAREAAELGPVQTIRSRPRQRQSLEDLAGEVLSGLYGALVGDTPRALRVYRDNDALLLLLRFDPELHAGADGGAVDSLAETSFMAMLELVAEVVSARGGLDVVPGNVRVCAARGLAVFALGLVEDEPSARCDQPTMARARLEKREGGLRLAG